MLSSNQRIPSQLGFSKVTKIKHVSLFANPDPKGMLKKELVH